MSIISRYVAKSAAICAALFGFLGGAAQDEAFAQSSARPLRELRSWTADDSIRLTYYSNSPIDTSDWSFKAARGVDAPITFSGDGAHFFIVRHRGNLTTDENEFELVIWNTASVLAALRDRRRQARNWTARFTSGSSSMEAVGISHVRFSTDRAEVTFIGTDRRSVANVYQIDLQRGAVRQLTFHNSNVLEYAVRGGAVAFRARAVSPAAREIQYPLDYVRRARVGAGEPAALSKREEAWARSLGAEASFAQANGGPAVALEGSSLLGSSSTRVGAIAESISPDGRFLVAVAGGEVRAYEVLDLSTGRRVRIAGLQICNAGIAAAAWSPDSQSVALLGAGCNERGRMDWRRSELGVYNRTTGRVETAGLGARSVPALNWGPDSRLHVHVPGDPPVDRVFRYTNGQLVEGTLGEPVQQVEGAVPSPPRGFQVSLRQNANGYPVVVATLNGSQLELTTRDPLLNEVWVSPARPFEVRIREQIVRGSLYLPRDFRAGHRIPVVIQNVLIAEDSYLPDGPIRGTVYTTQPVVARGIAVLQINGLAPAGAWPSTDVVANRLDTIIDTLVDSGIADPSRIALVGFSGAGWDVHRLLPGLGRHRLAAAIVNDSNFESFGQMLFRPDMPRGVVPAVEGRLGPTYWQAQQQWAAADVSFHVDRIDTPVLFTDNPGQGHGYGRQEYRPYFLQIMASFDLTRRPADFVVFPDGWHMLQRPREHAEMAQLVTDWLSFWLLHEMPADVDRAARWVAIRNNWLRQQAWEAAGNPVGSMPRN